MLIYMVQTSRNRWKIQAESGKILCDDIILSNEVEAEDFVKAYVSSWSWDYRLIPLEDV